MSNNYIPGSLFYHLVSKKHLIDLEEIKPIIIPSDVIQEPPACWMERLRPGNKAYLVKEDKYVLISQPYESPPEYRAGSIYFKHDGSFHEERWGIDIHGNGYDGKRLMLPVDGHLADDPCPLPGLEFRHLYRQFEKMRHENEQLRKVILDLKAKYLDLHDIHDIIK
jgi:hypothetical protein